MALRRLHKQHFERPAPRVPRIVRVVARMSLAIRRERHRKGNRVKPCPHSIECVVQVCVFPSAPTEGTLQSISSGDPVEWGEASLILRLIDFVI